MANKTQTHPLLKKLLSYISSSMVGEKCAGTSVYIISTLGESRIRIHYRKMEVLAVYFVFTPILIGINNNHFRPLRLLDDSRIWSLGSNPALPSWL